MDLKEYLDSNGIRYKFFAEKLGISHSYMSRLMHKKIVPSPALALKIEELTQGKVSKEGLIFPSE